MAHFTNITPVEDIMLTFTFEDFSDETFDLPIVNPESVILSAPFSGWVDFATTLRTGLHDHLNGVHDTATFVAEDDEYGYVINFLSDMGTNYDATIEIHEHGEAKDGYYLFVDMGDEYNQYQFVLNSDEAHQFISFMEKSLLLA